MSLKKLLAVIVLISLNQSLHAAVSVSGIFGDHMVLQQNMQVPVWGWAEVGEKIKVTFGSQSIATTADENGRWRVWLAPMKASDDPQTLSIASSNTIEFTDILIGEVWLCSGQSNMELPPTQGLVNPDVEINAANWPKIRLNLLDKVVADRPLKDLKGNWTACTPLTMRRFSAAAYFFGRELHQDLKVPIGLIGDYYGGSNGQSWTSRAALSADPDLNAYLTQWDARLANTPPTTAPDDVPQRPSNGNGSTSRYRPANFFNAMIAPLAPFAIRGVIWYQGEANTNNAHDAGLYAKLFPAMIKDWRYRWGESDFPFIFVQLPTSEPNYPDPTDSAWARVRESQQTALDLPNTAMIVTLDIGEGAVVHAHNKKDVGLRLAGAALSGVYDRSLAVCDYPLYSRMEIQGGNVVIHFAHADAGLVLKDPAKGFAISGADKNFVWADAKLDGNTVIVSSPKVPAPVAVRYAWADNPDVSLFSKNGLPAAPFRTDDWPAGKISNPRASP